MTTPTLLDVFGWFMGASIALVTAVTLLHAGAWAALTVIGWFFAPAARLADRLDKLNHEDSQGR